MRLNTPVLPRFVAKLVLDILPAALASLIGGYLVTHYGPGRAGEPAAQATPASAEMMQLLRDEHGVIVNFLNAQMANEKRRLAAEDAAMHRAADAQPAAGTAGPHQAAAISTRVAAKGARTKAPLASALPPPLVIAEARSNESAQSAAHRPESFFAKPVSHVVAATHHIVSVIGGIPSWFGSIGDHLGGDDARPRPPADLVSSS